MDQTQDNHKWLSIGSTVRLKSKVLVDLKPGLKRCGDDSLEFARRFVVATPPDDKGCVSLVQDDLAPTSLLSSGRFLIAPMNSEANQVEECEADVADIMPLLEFEEGAGKEGDVARYKECGDQLFRLNDYTSAISYYEAALHLVSSKFEVGSVLVVRRLGHSVIAEVDCVEDDTFDVTLLPGNNEATISRKDVIMALWTEDTTFLQVKILLNLSRCLLKLADFESSRSNDDVHATPSRKCRRNKLRQAAVTGCSAAISICEHHSTEISIIDSKSELDLLMDKAKIIRSRAFIALLKYPNAIADAKKVLARNSANHEAQGILAEINAAKAHAKSLDKRLSKEVCTWLQTATESTIGGEAILKTAGMVSVEDDNENCIKGGDEIEEPTQRNVVYNWGIVRSVCIYSLCAAAALFMIMSVLAYDKKLKRS